MSFVNTAAPPPQKTAPKPARSDDPNDNNYLHPVSRFCITIACSYIFTVLLVLNLAEFSWFLSPWLHLANLITGLLGVLYFHPITNGMRNFWDSDGR